jgi:hypothetical protein
MDNSVSISLFNINFLFILYRFQPFLNDTLDKWYEKVQATSGITANKKFKAIHQVS